jgi:hypothetical protein
VHPACYGVDGGRAPWLCGPRRANDSNQKLTTSNKSDVYGRIYAHSKDEFRFCTLKQKHHYRHQRPRDRAPWPWECTSPYICIEADVVVALHRADLAMDAFANANSYVMPQP